MNRSYSLVWNEAQQRYTVAHEKARRYGKPAARVSKIGAAVMAACLALAAGEAVAQSSCGSNPISTSVGGPCTLNSGASLTLSGTGTISGSTTGVAVMNGATAGNIANNNGTIAGNIYGIAVATYSSLSGGITNSGNISGLYTGITVAKYSGLSGGITNSGSILGGYVAGVLIANNATVTGTFTNSGTISSAPTGILINSRSGFVGDLTNSGVISGTQKGIAISTASNFTGRLTNSGAISGGNTGIAIENGGVLTGGITNSGTISSLNNRGILINTSNTLNGGITNSGTIFGGYAGITVGHDGALNDGLTNSGTISGGTIAGGVLVSGTLSGGLINSGTISGGANGVAITNGALNGGLTNSGTISGGANGIAFDSGGALNGGLINTTGGTISGNYRGILLVSAGSIANGLTNSGTITGGHTGIQVISSSAINGGLTNSGTISGGTYAIYVDSGSSIDAIHIAGSNTAVFVGPVYAPDTPVTVDSGATYTMNNGQLFTVQSFTNAGTLKIGAGSTGTITGDFTNTGTFSPTVASNTSYGKLTVSGTATLGGTLYVNVTGSSLSAGTLSSLIHATSISGTFATVSDNSTLFDFTASYTSTDVNLNVVSTSTNGAYSAALANGNTPGLNAARTLDQIFATNPTGSISTLFMGITGGTGAVSNAVSQTLPLLVSGTSGATQNALTGIDRIVQARQDANRGLSSGDDFYGDKNVWMKPFGSWAKQDDRDAVSGYKATTAGLIFGADAALNKENRVGVALAYANAHVTGNSTVAPSSATIDLYQLIGYGSYSLDANTELNYQADIGNNRNQGSRSIAFAGLTAASSYSTLTAHAGVGVGRTYALNERLSLTPSIRVDYTTIRDRAYSETGAGALNLNVNAQTTNQLLYSAEAKLLQQLDETTSLFGSLGAGYDARAKAANITASYAGASGLSFTTSGATPEHWLARGGLGVTSQVKNGPELTARYDIEHRTGFNDQTLSAKVRWAF